MVKLEFWVPQTTRDDVKAAVRAIVTDSTRSPALATRRRSSQLQDLTPGADHQMDAVIETPWTVPAIKTALDASTLIRDGEMTLRVLEGAEPVLLWPVSEQKDAARFNEFLLKAQRVVPLSNFAITNVGGEDVYELMGELSCKTTLQTILIELRTLAENAIDATDLRESFDTPLQA